MTIKLPVGLLAAAAMLPALSACQQPAATVDVAKETAAINAQIDAFNAAAKAKDATKAVAIDATDMRGYGGGPDVAGPDEDLKVTKAMMADPAYGFAVKPDHTEVAKSGELAFQTGSFEAAYTNPQTKAVEHAPGHFVAVWRKDAAGAWKLAAVSSANAPPAAAAMPDAKPPAAPAKK
jgi:ketosteroid isomerase-like protein